MRATTKVLLLFLILMAATLAITTESLIRIKQEARRLQGNQAALLDSTNTYRSRTGELVASIQALILTQKETKRHEAALLGEIAALRIRLKNVESVSTIPTTTIIHTPIPIPIRDTIYLSKPAQAFTWRDPWTAIEGVIQDSAIQELNHRSRDTITQVAHRVPYQFLFFRWGVKELRVDTYSKNPHTTIVAPRVIHIKQ